MPVPQKYTVNDVQYEYHPSMGLEDFSWYNNLYLDTREKIDQAKDVMLACYKLWLDDQY